MANTKSAKKRAIQNEKKRSINVTRRSDVKTTIKSVLEALNAKDVQAAESFFKAAESKITRAKGKGILKGNTAARKISRLAKKIHAAKAG